MAVVQEGWPERERTLNVPGIEMNGGQERMVERAVVIGRGVVIGVVRRVISSWESSEAIVV